MPDIWPINAWDIPEIPEISLRYCDMPELCLIYAWYMPEIHLRYMWDISEIYLRYAQDTSKICLRYARDMPEVCLRYAWGMGEIYLRYAWDIPEICMLDMYMRYGWDMVEIWLSRDWSSAYLWPLTGLWAYIGLTNLKNWKKNLEKLEKKSWKVGIFFWRIGQLLGKKIVTWKRFASFNYRS